MMEYQATHASPQRHFRNAVLAGKEPCPTVVALLESLGIDTNELQARLIQSREMVS
jgi:hypothetical protein